MTTGSPVWFVTELNSSTPLSFLEFEASFEGDAEGYLTIHLDNFLVAAIDQRYAGTGYSEYFLPFDAVPAGRHVLSFRLDPFADGSASIQIRNLYAGHVATVPELSSIVSALLGVSLIFVSRRHRLFRLTLYHRITTSHCNHE